MIEYTLAQLQALHDIANKTDDYFCRKVLRWYSKTFHTPLHQTESLPWLPILQHYYEAHYEALPEKDLLDIITDSVPNLSQAKEDEFLEFERRIIEEHKKQSLNSKPPESSKSEEPPTNNLPEVNKTFDMGENEF